MGTFDVGRRSVALSIAAGIMVCDYSKPSPAEAALVQFPVSELHNRYLLVRAGQGVREGQGIVFTNPVSKTSIDSGLDDTGKRQVVKLTAPALRDLGAADTPWLWAGINQRSYQTAEILGKFFTTFTLPACSPIAFPY